MWVQCESKTGSTGRPRAYREVRVWRRTRGIAPSPTRTSRGGGRGCAVSAPLHFNGGGDVCSPESRTKYRHPFGVGVSQCWRTLGGAGSLNVQIAGSGGVPSGGVSAAVLNVTVVGPTAASYLTVFPEGTTRPVVSNLDFTTNEILANLVTVPLGNQGGVTIFNAAGNVNVVVDLEGYYTTSPGATGLYNPVDPIRVLGNMAAGVTVGPGTSTPVTVAGVSGVPNDVSAIVANVTVAGSTSPGYLTVFPAPHSGSPVPVGLERELCNRTGRFQSGDHSRRGQRPD